MSNEKKYNDEFDKNSDAIDAEIIEDSDDSEKEAEPSGFSFGEVDDETTTEEDTLDSNEEEYEEKSDDDSQTTDEEADDLDYDEAYNDANADIENQDDPQVDECDDESLDEDENQDEENSEEELADDEAKMNAQDEDSDDLEDENQDDDFEEEAEEEKANEQSDDDFRTNFRGEIEAIKEEKRRQALEQKNADLAKKRQERQRQQLLKEEKKLEAQKERQRKFEEMAHKRTIERNKSEEEKSVSQAQKRRDRIVSSPKLAKKLRKKALEIERYEPDINVGLTQEQIDKRISSGLNNYKSMGSTKTISQIVIGNIITPFNILIFIIAGFLISVQSIKDLTFLVIVLLNLVIGIIQEISAKKTIDKLTLISAPTCDVLRDSKFQEVTINEVVLDDLISLKTGKQICSDSIVVEGQIEVNESLLTGEADAIIKRPGDILYSGSFVVSGTCIARVDKVGDDNYIERLTGQAKQYRKPKSELLKALNQIILVMGILTVVIGVSLFFVQYLKTGLDYETSIRKTAGAMIGMIPSGLYLVTSVALAVGVLRLAKNNVLVQELYCIEMLARVDVLCLDKTGTITDGTMNVRDVIDYDIIGNLSTKDIVSAMLNATNDQNLTNIALENKFGRAKRIKHNDVIPFSSQRKYSAVSFDGIGTIVLGAPEFVLKTNFKLVESDVNKAAKEGYRVLVIAHTNESIKDGALPQVELEPVSLILIEDNVRPDAIETISYFKEAGVEVKVISGDNPITVSKVAERAGITNAEKYISLDGLTDTEVVRAASKYTVFGRVSPGQKRLLVKSLQELGHKVAMTGDGVNDILALKEADCSIAVASGSEAARNVSHLVLLDSNFGSMPRVVSEGRRVISNIAKVAKLYLTKTMFSLLLAIVALIQGTYPISTNQLLMIDALCIGLPSLVLGLEPNRQAAPNNFLSTIIKSALPGAIVIVIQSILVFLLQNQLDMTARTTSTIIVIVATFTCMMVLYETCKPFINNTRKILFGSVFTIFVLATIVVPSFFDFAPIIPGLEYYSKSQEVMTWETQVVSISEANHYTVDGYVLEELCVRPSTTHSAEVDANGYLVVDTVVTTEYKPMLPNLTKTKNNHFAIGGNETSYIYNPDYEYELLVESNGNVSLKYSYNGNETIINTGYNILPTVTISNNYYIVNGYRTDVRTAETNVGTVTMDNNYKVYVSGVENAIFQLFDGKGLLISSANNHIWIGGDETDIEYDSKLESTLKIVGKEYYINNQKTNVIYTPEIDTTEEGYYIVNNKITDYKCKGSGTSIVQSLDENGYLKIDGLQTNIKVNYTKVVGGQVKTLPISSILLLFCLCLSSHPLIWLIKSIVPFSRKQFKKLTDVLNRI